MDNAISNIINNVISNFDFPFCVSVNIATYLIIKVIIDYKKTRKLSTWNKRGVFVLISIIAAIVYYLNGTDLKILFNSFILAPVSWSWIFKPICAKFGIDYNDKRRSVVKYK